MGEELEKMPEVVKTENKGFQPEIAEVKSGNSYQPEIVETVQRNPYQPVTVEANQNEYTRRTPGNADESRMDSTAESKIDSTAESKIDSTVENRMDSNAGNSVVEAPEREVQKPVFTEWERKQEPETVSRPAPEAVAPAPTEKPATQPEKRKKEKKERKGPNFFVRALMAIACGILFGVFAGASFFAIKTVAGKIFPSGVGVGIIAGGGSEEVSELDSENENSEPDTEEVIVPAAQSSIVDVAKDCMPSIVIINVVVEYNYYGTAQDVPGSGSGIIVGQNDEELFIATNYHVIADAKTVDVQFCDGSTAPAAVKGKKVNMDLAVITVDISSLGNSTMSQIKIASIGDSDNLEVGETAIAIGNALGYGQSVTVGVISALDREVTTSSGETNRFIQTDAAINPGNSGGALINMKGEVIGINSNKLGGSAVEGMGYAIPITVAKPIIEKLIAKQELVALPEDQQSYFGIRGSEVKSGLYTNEGVSIPGGIYVNQVQPGTPAEEAGIQKNDIITEFEGDSVTNMAELMEYLAAYPAGSKVKITFRRYENYKFVEHEVEVTLTNKSVQPQNP